MEKNKDYIHKEYPKTCDPKDFFGQVKRTVNGKPISQDQIDQIVDAITKGLDLKQHDVVLDIGCGNGALSVLFFDRIKAYTGIDFSEYLVQVAKENFEREGFEFKCAEALSFLQNCQVDDRVTKVLCYGVFSYFEKDNAAMILSLIADKFPNATTAYIGNLPDRDLAHKFYYSNIDFRDLLDDHTSSIGIWRTVKEMEDLAANTGWEASFVRMQEGFYTAHYRYDVRLTRKQNNFAE